MKFRNKKINNIIRKGLALTLAVSMFGGLLPALPAKAADYTVDIDDALVGTYRTTILSKGYGEDQAGKDKDRIVTMSEFLHDKNNSIRSIVNDNRDSHETDKVVWNPTQAQVNDGRDLYFLQWTNGTEYQHPRSGYEIMGRIVYITKTGDVRYSKKVNLDKYPRNLLDLGNYEQWNHGVVNQCYFAMPEDCAQIVGIFMGNYSNSGMDNNSWWMDSLTISRITSDKVSDINSPLRNSSGYNECSFNNGKIVAFVSKNDIEKRYLQTYDVQNEGLYLLRSADDNQAVPTGGAYYAQIVTGENTDLSGKKLQLTVTYTDIAGISYTVEETVDDSTVTNFYPELTRVESFDDDSFTSYDIFEDYLAYDTMYALEPYKYKYFTSNFDYHIGEDWYKTLVNDIALEIPRNNAGVSNLDIMTHLKTDGYLPGYSWDEDNMTITNLYGALLFGNFVTSAGIKDNILGPKTATDIPLNIPHQVAEITEIKLSVKSGSTATLQDVRIYTASPDSFNHTRMNGGMSTERVFYDVKNAYCLASVDADSIQLNGDGTVTCTLNPAANNNRQYKLIHPDQEMDFMGEDDNLGINISLADLYDAGLDFFMSKTATIDADTAHLLKNLPDAPGKSPDGDHMFNMAEVRRTALVALQYKNYNALSNSSAIELLNLLENYYKESLNLNITYKDDLGAVRQVKVPFITSYLLQLYSDNEGELGYSEYTHIAGIFQQGQDVALRVPLSQYSDIVEMSLSFGKSPDGVMNFRNNKWYYIKRDYYNYVKEYSGSKDIHEVVLEFFDSNLFTFISYDDVKKKFWTNETLTEGIKIPNDETFTIRAIRLYNNVTKEEFHTYYDPGKRIATLSNSRKNSDYYYAAKDKNGYTVSNGSVLNLSPSNGTLTKGSIDYSKQDLKNTYLVEIIGQNMYDDKMLVDLNAKDLYVTLAYTTTGGEEKKIQSKRLSSLSKDYNGKSSLSRSLGYDTAYEYQTAEDLKDGKIYFTIDLDDVARFDYIYLSLPSGETYGFQANSITIYDLESLGQRYSRLWTYTAPPVFSRDFVGERVAFNNKPGALQPNKEGITFYFTKVNSDGTLEEPGTDNTYDDEYLTTPPTSMTYEETLKNLGLAINKYTYTVDVKVANVMDAGSSNYFYFQLVFENGTSGVVLANQQLAADSFRQGYTESFTINTTQNYGNVTAVRVICDTSSSTSQAFDKLNIENITVTLPNKGSAKSWIVDKVGWIDINYQDEGVATTVSDDGRSGGFPNSQVVKEFARTRTASTARLLFSIATAAESSSYTSMPYPGTFEASLVYEDTSGYTQTYNFDLRSAVYNFIENENASFIFRQNTSDHFTLSINDIASVKALNIYRSGGNLHWTIKDITISQFSDIGNVYRSTTGEFKRYIEDETLLTTSTNSNVMIEGAGSATFTFADNSIVMDVATTDPATWTTTITRIPTTTQENLNVYLYAGSNDDRTYTFNTANLPSIKGRMEYTLKDGGSTIGSTSFNFDHASTINGTTVLKATGIKTTGMNQLKTLHLETSSAGNPIISGARVERIRGNTIVETLYFDFGNVSMNAGENYSAIAKEDTLSSSTKQIVALQLTSGQEQLFTTSSDVAVAIHYTTESSAQDATKALYSSPYVFFTDVGINSLGNTSILEIPFEVSGVDQVVGISIVSTGPNVKFENAIVYNYILNANGERTLIDTCQIPQAFSTSTVEKQYTETEGLNVTPVTLSFTTSADSKFPGAGTSGRLPLSIHYKTSDGSDKTLQIDNFSAYLPANTLPTAGSTVSFNVQLSNFSHLTDIALSAADDDWHLNKVSAEVKKLNNASSTSYKTEAFVNQWVTSRTPATAVFSGNDAQNSLNEIVSFSVTGKTSKFGNVATATSGNVLTIKATPGENVTFTPQVTATGTLTNTVVWDTSNYASYMNDSGNAGLTFRVPANSVGQVYSFTGYCSFDKQKSVTIAIEVVDVPATEGGGTTGDGTGNNDSAAVDESFVNVSVTGASMSLNIPTFYAKDGESQTCPIFVKSTQTNATWQFTGIGDNYTVTFNSPTLSVGSTVGTQSTVMTCKNNVTGKTFTVTFNVIVVSGLSMTYTLTNMTNPSEPVVTKTLYENSNEETIEVDYSATPVNYKLTLTTTDQNGAKAALLPYGSVIEFNNQANGTSINNGETIKSVTAKCFIGDDVGYSISAPIVIKVKNQTTTP